MEPDQTVAMFLVFSIPILAIVLGFAKDYLKLRTQQRTSGESDRERDRKIERLERVNAEYAQRLENLEAIVVSQTWSASHDKPRLAAEGEGIVPVRPHEVAVPSREDLNRQRAADLARRAGE